MTRKDLTEDQNAFRDLILAAITVEKLLKEFPEKYRTFLQKASGTKNISAEAMEAIAYRGAIRYIETKVDDAIAIFEASIARGMNAGIKHANSAYGVKISEIDEEGYPVDQNANRIIRSKKKGKIEPVKTSVNAILGDELLQLGIDFMDAKYVIHSDRAAIGPRIGGQEFSSSVDYLDRLFQHISGISRDYPRVFNGMFTPAQERGISRDSPS